MLSFSVAPLIRRVALSALPVRQTRTIRNELVGESNGLPDQTYRLSQPGVVLDDASQSSS